MGHQISRRDHSTARPAHWHLSGRLEGNGAADPTVFDTRGDFVTATQDATGIYTITLKDTWPKLIGYSMTVLGSNDLVVFMTAEAINTAGTITIVVQDLAGTDTDLTSSDLLYVSLDVTNSASVG